MITSTIWLRYSESLEDQRVPYHDRVAKLDTQLNDPLLKNAQDYLRKGQVINLRSNSKEDIKASTLVFTKLIY